VFYNTLNGNLPQIADSEQTVCVWLPKDRFTEAAISHVIANAADNIEQVFVEEGFEFQKMASAPPLNHFHISPDLPKGRIKKIAFFAANDTIAKSFVNVINKCKEHFDLSLYIPVATNENAGAVFESNGLAYKKFSFSDLLKQKIDVLIFGNDWTKEAKYIIAKCRKPKIKTLCIQESVIDFGDPSAKRMRWADFALIQGAQTVLELDRKHYFVTGNPRYENIELSGLPEAHKAFINCNFTYNIHERIRNWWLTDIIKSLDEAGVEYLISQHPRDRGDLHSFKNVYRSNAQIVHQQLRQCSFVITRFSSLIHEALCMGRKVIYYNPHSESMKYDFGFDNNLLFCCRNRQELSTSISSITNSKATTYEEFGKYLGKHCILLSSKPSDIITKVLMESNLQQGDGLTIKAWPAALRYYRYRILAAMFRSVTKLVKPSVR
jgi:hypothetical protein